MSTNSLLLRSVLSLALLLPVNFCDAARCWTDSNGNTVCAPRAVASNVVTRVVTSEPRYQLVESTNSVESLPVYRTTSRLASPLFTGRVFGAGGGFLQSIFPRWSQARSARVSSRYSQRTRLAASPPPRRYVQVARYADSVSSGSHGGYSTAVSSGSSFGGVTSKASAEQKATEKADQQTFSPPAFSLPPTQTEPATQSESTSKVHLKQKTDEAITPPLGKYARNDASLASVPSLSLATAPKLSLAKVPTIHLATAPPIDRPTASPPSVLVASR